MGGYDYLTNVKGVKAKNSSVVGEGGMCTINSDKGAKMYDV